jgi:hypothetical protein
VIAAAAGAGGGHAAISPRVRGSTEPASTGSHAGERGPRGFLRWTWWAALPFGLLYLILLAHQLDSAIRITNLDADAASGPVIGELFGAAPAHANVVLGTFAWYSTLLFDLATKWLPYHRTVWEAAPYAMVVAGAALTAWSVSQVASRWAAGLTAVLLISTSPATLRVELATTQHAPSWFCLALLGAFAVWLERRRSPRWPVLIVLVLAIGTIVGVNAASDPLLDIAGVAPFGLALIATRVLAPGRDSTRAMWSGLAMLAVTGVTWAITAVVMSALSVAREPGLHTTRVVVGHKDLHNFTLWWKSIATLGNGNYFGHALSPATVLAFVCAVISVAAVVSIPWLSWRQLRHRSSADPPTGGSDPLTDPPADPARTAFYVFWCSSAILLTLAFLFSATPVDIYSGRYLVGLLYAAAAVVPAAVAGRVPTKAIALAGTCVFALGAVVSIAQQGPVPAPKSNTAVTSHVADQIERIATRDHLTVGYAGYWDAAPVTWATGFHVKVYPVSVCDQRKHLCRFDLHFISSWYWPRAHAGSFLLTDPALSNVWIRPSDLGRPTAVYRVGRLTMYVYPYDLAARIRSTA